VFDDMEPCYDLQQLAAQDWSRYYPIAKRAIPENTPGPQGKLVMMTCFVHVDCAGCQLMRQLHAGVALFINWAPII
jgi:hypothetical protein